MEAKTKLLSHLDPANSLSLFANLYEYSLSVKVGTKPKDHGIPSPLPLFLTSSLSSGEGISFYGVFSGITPHGSLPKYIERRKERNMSHYDLKAFHINKKGNPEVKIADSNVYPQTFEDYEYNQSDNPKDNLEKFCMDLLDGTVQPKRIKAMHDTPNRPGSVLNAMLDYRKRYAPDVSYSKDLSLDTTTTYNLYRILTEKYGVPMLKKEVPNIAKLEELLRAVNEEAKSDYLAAQRSFDEQGIVLVNSASISDFLPGYDILWIRDNEECIIAKQENYGNNGKLDNKDNSAVFLGDNSSRIYHTLTSDGGGLTDAEFADIIGKVNEKAPDGFNAVACVTLERTDRIISEKTPLGMFVSKTGNGWMAIDNNSGEAHVEVFGDKYSAIAYLRGNVPREEFCFEIYQLKDNDDLRDYHFSSYENLRTNRLKVEGKNYNKMYSGKNTQNSLEGMFEEFNINRPSDFYGHSLSVSDVIVLRSGNAASAFYVDDIGFRPLQGFEPVAEKELMEELSKALKEKYPDAPGEKYSVVCTFANNTSTEISPAMLIKNFETADNRENPLMRNFTVCLDPFGRNTGNPYSRTARFSDIARITDHKGDIIYERPEFRNKRLVETARRNRETVDNGVNR